MVFDVRRNVFVVGVRALQVWHVRVWHGIIPPQRFALASQFVKVFDNALREEVYLLEYVEHMPGVKEDLTACHPNGLADRVHCQSVTCHGGAISQE